MSSNKFDWEYYINKYEDLKILGINNKQKAIEHYKKFGKNENKFPNKIAEVTNNKINKYNKNTQNNKFLENISFELDIDEQNITSIYNSLSENDQPIENSLSENDQPIENIISQLKKDVDNIKTDINTIKYSINQLFMILSKDKVFSLPNNTNLNNIKSVNNNISLDETSKIMSSEEYEVCDNLSESSDDKETINYSNTDNSDDISYDKS